MKKSILFLFVWPALFFGQRAYSQAIADSADYYLNGAQLYLQQENMAEAQKYFIKAAELQPVNDAAYIGWFRVSMETGQVEEGLKAINSWVEHNPGNSQAWLYKGFLEAEMNHPEEALKAFDKLIELQPDEAGNYVGRGQMLYSLDRYEEALEAFDKSLTMDPSRNDVRGMKAAALSGLGRFDEAFSILNAILEKTPDDPVSLYNRACLFSLKGDRANAIADLKRAIELEPSFKNSAVEDKDFKDLYDDEEFIRLTGQN